MPYADSDGVRIYYEVSGEGRPFVWVHANPFDHNLLLYQVAHFSTWFRVIALDIRGYGRSDKPTAEFSLRDMADDVLAVCRAEGVGEAVVGGVSVGSGIALLLGLDHPETFRGVVLVGGSSGGGARTGDRIRGYTGDAAAYHEKHIRELVAPGFADTKLGRYLLGIFLERNPWLSGESIAQIFRARAGADMTPRLSEMKAPTLVVNGEHDLSLEGGRRTAELIPGAVHKVLPGTGHACCIEDPAGFDALVLEFLRDNALMD